MSKQIYISVIAIIIILFPNSCSRKKEHNINFYYWKTNVNIGEVEKDYFEKLNSKKLYIRFFDVDKEQGLIDYKALIKPFDSGIINAEYIPVIFITNRIFLNISNDEMLKLVENIYELTKRTEEANSIPESKEIQIDCDWTEKTAGAYFMFLEILKDVSGRKISCTLRLHQIKFKKKTGIPPVDKGYLMCYATSDPTEKSDKNSILDIELLKDYTQNINDYPLNFDIALPIYSWGIVTNHLGKIKIINALTEKDLQTSDFTNTGNNQYTVNEDLFLKGMYINKGFKIKIETITPDLLKEAKEYLDEKINNNYEIVYYHLDEQFLTRYTIDDLR